MPHLDFNGQEINVGDWVTFNHKDEGEVLALLDNNFIQVLQTELLLTQEQEKLWRYQWILPVVQTVKSEISENTKKMLERAKKHLQKRDNQVASSP